MYKIFIIIFFIFINTCFADISGLLKEDRDQVLKIVDGNRALEKSFISTIEVSDKDLSLSSENKFILRVVAEQEKSFAIYKFPSNQKGQTILNVGQNIWIYIPNTSNPIKISPQQKLVGQASIADIVSLLYYKNYTVASYNKENNNSLLASERNSISSSSFSILEQPLSENSRRSRTIISYKEPSMNA